MQALTRKRKSIFRIPCLRWQKQRYCVNNTFTLHLIQGRFAKKMHPTAEPAANENTSHLSYSLNFHSWRHMGQSCCTCWELSHFMMQWMWKQCEHWPHTSGQSSPGILQSGQHPSKATRHIPQLSSLAIQRQEATLVQRLIVTFIPIARENSRKLAG